jgi:hypothetical protein
MAMFSTGFCPVILNRVIKKDDKRTVEIFVQDITPKMFRIKGVKWVNMETAAAENMVISK